MKESLFHKIHLNNQSYEPMMTATISFYALITDCINLFHYIGFKLPVFCKLCTFAPSK